LAQYANACSELKVAFGTEDAMAAASVLGGVVVVVGVVVGVVVVVLAVGPMTLNGSTLARSMSMNGT